MKKIIYYANRFLIITGLIFVPKIVFGQASDVKANCDKFIAKFTISDGTAGANIFSWVPEKYCSLGGLVSWATQTLLELSGVAAVIFIIVGGFWLLTSGGNEEQAEKGKKTLTNSIIGLVVIIMAYAIVRVVTNLLMT